jgi:hypothetical protein
MSYCSLSECWILDETVSGRCFLGNCEGSSRPLVSIEEFHPGALIVSRTNWQPGRRDKLFNGAFWFCDME